MNKLGRNRNQGYDFGGQKQINRSFSGSVVYYKERGNVSSTKLGSVYRKRDSKSLEQRVKDKKDTGFYYDVMGDEGNREGLEVVDQSRGRGRRLNRVVNRSFGAKKLRY